MAFESIGDAVAAAGDGIEYTGVFRPGVGGLGDLSGGFVVCGGCCCWLFDWEIQWESIVAAVFGIGGGGGGG